MIWRQRRARRVQFAVGGFAIAAATLMFLLTRGGEPSMADASTALAAPPPLVETATPSARMTAYEAAPPATPPNLAPEIMAKPVPHAVKIETKIAADSKPAIKVVPSSTLKRPSTRNAPAMPRRTAARLDPNGVIDPY
jgi:hypothetical protein